MTSSKKDKNGLKRQENKRMNSVINKEGTKLLKILEETKCLQFSSGKKTYPM